MQDRPGLRGAPPADLPAAFRAGDDPAFIAEPGDHERWWHVFGDAQLDGLIARAEADSLDLRIAVARVNEARARARLAEADRAPQVSLGGGAGAARDATTGFDTRSSASLSLEAAWEADVFGRIARGIEAAEADFQASEEDRRDVQVTLFAEVARAYLGVRSLQAQLAAAERNIASQREVLALTQTRFRDGIASALEVAQASELLAATEADVPPLRIDLSRQINTIALLIGTHPGSVHDELSEPQPVPFPRVDVAVGMPADLLRQRPDIRAAERRLAAQSARLGVAAADLYPSFSLGGRLSLGSVAGAGLLDPASRSFALGPSIRWQLFDGGRVRSRIAVENARLEQSVLLYERAVLAAMEEVESALTSLTEQRIRVEAIGRAAAAAAETLRLAMSLYRDGLIQFQDVLTAQQRKLAAETAVARARGTGAQHLVQLYVALGGGWDPAEADALTATPSEDAAADVNPDAP